MKCKVFTKPYILQLKEVGLMSLPNLICETMEQTSKEKKLL